MADWQPIETAPKDGSDILIAELSKAGYMVYIGQWWGGLEFFATDAGEVFQHPTHWMPLPMPPEHVA